MNIRISVGRGTWRYWRSGLGCVLLATTRCILLDLVAGSQDVVFGIDDLARISAILAEIVIGGTHGNRLRSLERDRLPGNHWQEEHWVHPLAVLLYFKVNVATRGVSRGASKCNHIAASDGIAHTN